MEENSPSSSLTDYISAIGGAAGQVIAAVNGPKTAAAGAPKAAASTGFPMWIVYAVIGVVVLLGGFLILRRR